MGNKKNSSKNKAEKIVLATAIVELITVVAELVLRLMS